MPSLTEARGPHPCLERGCGHPANDHLPTPELAGPNEVIVWCSTCHRHESRRRRTWFRRAPRSEAAQRGIARVGRAM